MVFLLFLFSIISALNLLLALFFPYPAPLIGIILQFLFSAISIMVFISRIRKKKGRLGSFVMTSYHTSAFLLILYVFFNISLPNREEGESNAFVSGINGLLRYFQGETPRIPSDSTESRQNPTLNISNPPSHAGDSPVEDPF